MKTHLSSLAMIAAASANHVIGRDGRLPWHIPTDLKFFKNTTRGHAVIMGRKTYATLLGPLPKRHNIILTRDLTWQPERGVSKPGRTPPRVTVVHDLDAALVAAGDDPMPFITGGEEIYRLALPRATRIYLTRIHCQVENGDAFFPEIDPQVWTLTGEVDHLASEGRPAFTFQTWERLSNQ